MKKMYILSLIGCFMSLLSANAQDAVVSGPDGRLKVEVYVPEKAEVNYTVTYDGKTMVDHSALGLITNIGRYGKRDKLLKYDVEEVEETYTLNRIKTSLVNYKANRLVCDLQTPDGLKYSLEFQVSQNDVAFRYVLQKHGETGSVRVMKEQTAFHFPSHTTTFLTPQSDAMIGWKRTKPSYEEYYKADAPMNIRSEYGHGYTFPCLFHLGNDGWVLVSETGVDSRYCGSRLSDCQFDTYTIEYPMAEENNGNGTSEPAFSLPGATPWRTLTIGSTLKPIVETTVAWDVVKPLYETTTNYQFGKGTWSWILWQDSSVCYEDQVKFIDLSAAMGYKYVLIDNLWDTQIGRDKMKELIDYAHSRKVDVFVWYSSSGYWNDIVQGPTNLMDNSIIRKKEMRWLQSLGVKGIKVDFFGGDKQETIRLYEQILSDADDHGLMVIFHGCTIPRGWERMYPNYVGSEAVRASENLVFNQSDCDQESFNACLHPFIRNTLGSMEFGGCFMNHRLSKNQNRGNIRRTTDVFQLATAILFQNPIQNFALAPNNLEDAPSVCLDFLKQVPTTWNETRFLDGYPGQYAVLARRSGNTWYIGGISASQEVLHLKLDIASLGIQQVQVIEGGDTPKSRSQKVKGQLAVTLNPNDGLVLISE